MEMDGMFFDISSSRGILRDFDTEHVSLPNTREKPKNAGEMQKNRSHLEWPRASHLFI
jgi:hypothetical protein